MQGETGVHDVGRRRVRVGSTGSKHHSLCEISSLDGPGPACSPSET